ncbi:hypothetical protein DOTSEDRAFT_70117, partial [Dothistroma septosporum NZE10]
MHFQDAKSHETLCNKQQSSVDIRLESPRRFLGENHRERANEAWVEHVTRADETHGRGRLTRIVVSHVQVRFRPAIIKSLVHGVAFASRGHTGVQLAIIFKAQTWRHLLNETYCDCGAGWKTRCCQVARSVQSS